MSDDKKSSYYRGYTQAQNKASQKYVKTHLEEVKCRVPKGKKAYFQAAASNAGMSLTQFIIRSMEEKIERDNLVPEDVPDAE